MRNRPPSRTLRNFSAEQERGRRKERQRREIGRLRGHFVHISTLSASIGPSSTLNARPPEAAMRSVSGENGNFAAEQQRGRLRPP